MMNNHELSSECVRMSRIIGADRTLVAHGGGNTSVKMTVTNLYGDPVEAVWVKASGYDLANIDEDGFALLDLERVRRIVELDTMTDTAMINELIGARFDVEGPSPSVETILHAVLPYRFVVHAHPNALLALSNTADGEERIRALYGDSVVVVPYAMPGFEAAKRGTEAFRRDATDATTAMILMHHGVFAFGDTADEALERMRAVVDAADALTELAPPVTTSSPQPLDRVALASLRRDLSKAAGRPLIVHRHTDARSWAFSQRSDLDRVSQQGVATPDHALWTKNLPLLGRDVDSFVAAYRSYLERHSAGRTIRQRDPAPRVVLDPEFGLVTAGVDVAAEAATADISFQIIDTIERAEALGGYVALPESDIFNLEYWELEQRKLDRFADPREFTGEVAIVTGAASGIGRGCALSLLDRGAAVVGFDISESVTEMTDHPNYLGVVCDQTAPDQVSRALDIAVERFGGLDMVVASAGLFPESSPIAQHDPAMWDKAMSVNVDALIRFFALIHPLLVLAPQGGRVAVIGSKNVPAPGPGASAYSASKAAANQVARVAALEWAPDGIRINSVHPDAVFDTALWTPELLAERAHRYQMSIEDYKRRNLMGVEITSAAVGDLVAALLGNPFRCTTGAHVTIDGGNERTI
ncbi:MAG: bifunctional aldolase/short-chain dehydrogenase [Planctomycetota bacterium]|nr:MAG: bifunctional aldolase/short-chain dehydrogenase [Planctomycetota bacterium]